MMRIQFPLLALLFLVVCFLPSRSLGATSSPTGVPTTVTSPTMSSAQTSGAPSTKTHVVNKTPSAPSAKKSSTSHPTKSLDTHAPCVKVGSKCSGGQTCCSPLKCFGGKCAKCARTHLNCATNKDCCNSKKKVGTETCQLKKCKKCRKKKSKCIRKKAYQCCSKKCVKKRCQ